MTTTNHQTREESGARPRIVAVTSHRPHEVASPLERVDGAATVIRLDQRGGFFHRNLAAVRETRRSIVRHDPDALLLDCRELTGAIVALVALLSRVPVVFRFKGNYWRGLTEAYRPEKGDGLLRALRKHLSLLTNEVSYAIACGFIVVSSELQDAVVRRTDCPPERIEVVPVPSTGAGTDGSASTARERYDLDEETVVLTVTNLTYRDKYEGVKTTVLGMQRVLADTDDVAYVVAGGGPYQSDLEALVDRAIADRDVRDRIYTPGFVEDVADLYALADEFVYVSHIDGYPNAVLEAQEAGLPVIVNGAHGMVEQVNHGETGIILERAAPETVAEAVTRLLDDPDERHRLGENARDRVRRENDPATVGRDIVSAVTNILMERR